MTAYCLVVDDEPDILELFSITLAQMGIACHTAGNLHQAKTYLTQQKFQLCLTDMKLPDGNGIELVSHIQQHYPELPVAMVTAYGNMETAIAALKAGAFDFISKPVDIQNMRHIILNALKLPAPALSAQDKNMELIGQSPAIKQLRRTIEKLARSQAPIYINGESGTGKERVAQLIHSQGARADQPFIPVNCGAIPTELVESEFFGHKKGSFTGAVSNKQGLFQAAQGGTLFLDEIADLILPMQVKLLRAIQEKRIRPVGAEIEIPVDVRILSATHKDLAQLVNQGLFRQDLFYRINVIEVNVPPLRERTEDIPLFCDALLQRIIGGKDKVLPKISLQAHQALLRYAFPGNVRELENILERAVTLCENHCIEMSDLKLPQTVVLTKMDNELNADSNAGLDPLLNTIEKETILHALAQARWNKTKAAKLLGISFGALRYRLQKLKLE
jgi:two-component system response regulator PilR (NtrC family)